MKPYTVGDRPLDDQQMAAAMDDGPTKLVIAGAGTGKTTTLVGRLKHLRDEDVDPNGILVISLTNASVDDLRRKISSEMPGYRPDVMTIHALGNRILRKRPMVGTDRAEMIGNILGSLVSKDRRAANAMLLHVDGMRRSGSSDLSYSGATIRNRGLRNISDILFECGISSVYNPPSYSGKEPMPAFIEVDDGKGHRFKLHQDDPPVISTGKKPEEGWAYLDSRGLDMDRIDLNNLAVFIMWHLQIATATALLETTAKVTLIRNNTHVSFITGDQPIINLKYDYSSGDISPTELELYYPISPYLALLINAKTMKNEVTIDEKQVEELNQAILHASKDFIIGNSKELLELYQQT